HLTPPQLKIFAMTMDMRVIPSLDRRSACRWPNRLLSAREHRSLLSSRILRSMTIQGRTQVIVQLRARVRRGSPRLAQLHDKLPTWTMMTMTRIIETQAGCIPPEEVDQRAGHVCIPLKRNLMSAMKKRAAPLRRQLQPIATRLTSRPHRLRI